MKQCVLGRGKRKPASRITPEVRAFLLARGLLGLCESSPRRGRVLGGSLQHRLDQPLRGQGLLTGYERIPVLLDRVQEVADECPMRVMREIHDAGTASRSAVGGDRLGLSIDIGDVERAAI